MNLTDLKKVVKMPIIIIKISYKLNCNPVLALSAKLHFKMFKNSGSGLIVAYGQTLEIGERLDGTKKIYRLEQEKQASLTVLFRIAADQTSVLCRIFRSFETTGTQQQSYCG